MKRAIYVLPLFAALVLLSAAPAQAQAMPSFRGPTGGLFTPSNVFLPQGGFNAGYHFVGNGDRHIFKGNLGLAERLEVGVGVITRSGRRSRSDVQLNGKFLLLAEGQQGFDLSVGILDVTDSTDVYVYASRDFSELATRRLVLGLGIGSGSLDGVFANGNLTISPNADLHLEFISSDFNAGVRFFIGQNLGIDVALIDLSDLGVGIGWTTGGARSRR